MHLVESTWVKQLMDELPEETKIKWRLQKHEDIQETDNHILISYGLK